MGSYSDGWDISQVSSFFLPLNPPYLLAERNAAPLCAVCCDVRHFYPPDPAADAFECLIDPYFVILPGFL